MFASGLKREKGTGEPVATVPCREDLRAGWSGSVVHPRMAPAGLAPHSPYPGFGNQPEFHRLDFALVDANHALDELDTQVNVGRHKLRTKHPAGWRYRG